ncbi:hypothetical protein JCM19232_5661 [Vibrio ishigakensis]|uniref:Uncharacterized protein n=1 Tax=Vibrio ishigakensis TaxID=1481914 RepID=A0A0B8P3L5_9VIBR|nr:hypothetical protein JCM19232_5661 [Vibrio ishigakensis]
MPISTLNKIQWNENYAEENWIFLNSKTMKLNSLSEEQKSEIIDDLAPPSLHNKRKKQVQLNNYRSKLKKAIKTETNNGNSLCAEFLMKLLSTPPSVDIELTSALATLRPLLNTRANQRLNAVEKFIKAHNILTNEDMIGSSTLCQEIIFKIPEKWEISSDQLSHNDCFNIVRNFVRRILPNHPIKFAVSHTDENLEGTKYCSHIHLFISGKNELTKEFDLRKYELKSLDEYVKQHSLDLENWEHAKRKTKYYQSKARGHVWQEMFLRNCNAYFSHNKLAIEATRAIKTKEYQAQLQEMRAESKRSKSERTYSYYNYLIQQLPILKNEISSTVAEIDCVQVELRELITQKNQTQELNHTELKTLDALKLYISELENKAYKLLEAQSTLDTNIANSEENLSRKQRDYNDLNNAAQLLERKLTKAQQQITEAEAKAYTYLRVNKELETENRRLIQKNQELAVLENIQSEDHSYEPVLKIIKLIDDYYDLKLQKKSEPRLQRAESLVCRIKQAFSSLTNRLQQILVLKYTKAKDQLINNFSLSKSLKTLQTKHLDAIPK